MAKITKERKQEIADLREVMSTAAGRRFVWRQMEIAGIFQPCYDDHAEGGRRVGLFLLQEIITEAPGDYLKMQNEQMSQETRKRVEQERNKKGENEDETIDD